jgi:hypothetical protein
MEQVSTVGGAETRLPRAFICLSPYASDGSDVVVSSAALPPDVAGTEISRHPSEPENEPVASLDDLETQLSRPYYMRATNALGRYPHHLERGILRIRVSTSCVAASSIVYFSGHQQVKSDASLRHPASGPHGLTPRVRNLFSRVLSPPSFPAPRGQARRIPEKSCPF